MVRRRRTSTMDARFSHNHAYFDRGYVVHDLPRDRIVINRGPDRYFYSGGIWYAPRGAGFVVVGPPIGVFIPVLPPYYSTVWFGGVPYYYANDTYYMWNAPDNGYEVVDPPAGAVNAAPDAQCPAATDHHPAVHLSAQRPKRGSAVQGQVRVPRVGDGPDPALIPRSPAATCRRISSARRARTTTARWRACLQGRGYSVE